MDSDIPKKTVQSHTKPVKDVQCPPIIIKVQVLIPTLKLNSIKDLMTYYLKKISDVTPSFLSHYLESSWSVFLYLSLFQTDVLWQKKMVLTQSGMIFIHSQQHPLLRSAVKHVCSPTNISSCED